jgi:hypothetical protein
MDRKNTAMNRKINFHKKDYSVSGKDDERDTILFY